MNIIAILADGGNLVAAALLRCTAISLLISAVFYIYKAKNKE